MTSPDLVLAALDTVRAPVRDQLAEVLSASNVVGVQGPAHVGKTAVLRRALAATPPVWGPVVVVDLEGACSKAHLNWLLVRGWARARVDPVTFSHLTALDRSVWPSSARAAALTIGRELGALADAALESNGPPRGWSASVGDVLDVFGRITRRHPLTLLFEHLEAPSLTPRHPIDVNEFLWQVRALSQRRRNLQVVMTARTQAVAIAAGRHGAFHGDGRWITLANPDLSTWAEVAELVWGGRSGGVNACCDLTGGHVPTMMRLLSDERSRTDSGARAAFQELSAQSATYATRCVEHARSLHRLGGIMLTHVAHDDRPYAAVPTASPKEAQRALHALALAGLIHQPAPRRWQLTDPLVAHALRGLLPRFPVPE